MTSKAQPWAAVDEAIKVALACREEKVAQFERISAGWKYQNTKWHTWTRARHDREVRKISNTIEAMEGLRTIWWKPRTDND